MTRSSGGRPGFSPIFCKLEPVAPSATSTSPALILSKNFFIDSPYLTPGAPSLAGKGTGVGSFHKILCHWVSHAMWDQMRDMWEWFAHVRETRCQHKLILEFRVSRQFESFHAARHCFDFLALLYI